MLKKRAGSNQPLTSERYLDNRKKILTLQYSPLFKKCCFAAININVPTQTEDVFRKALYIQTLFSRTTESHKTPQPSAGKTGSENYLPVDKTFSHQEGLYKKHKKWRDMEVVNFWHSSSGETCSNQSQEGIGLKVDGNEKRGGQGRPQQFSLGLALWRFRVICNLKVLFPFKKSISISACYSFINRHCLDEQQSVANFLQWREGYVSANILAQIYSYLEQAWRIEFAG